jgi:hypothetical protein
MNRIIIENVKENIIKAGSVIVFNAAIDMEQILSNRRIAIVTSTARLIDLESGKDVTAKFLNLKEDDHLSYPEIAQILQPFIVKVCNENEIIIRSGTNEK